MKASSCVRRSKSVRSLSSTPTVTGYEWVRNYILKYKSSLTSMASVAVLQCQVNLANPEDFCKLAVQACGSDDFLFLRVVPSCLLFFFMYICLFEVSGVILPLTASECALLEHLNVASSQVHLNHWETVRAFKILYPFFNIRPNVLVFLFLFQMKLSGNIEWVFLNNVSKKLFEFDSNIFCYFKGRFFKVLATGVVADGMPLMFNRNGEPHFLFY